MCVVCLCGRCFKSLPQLLQLVCRRRMFFGSNAAATRWRSGIWHTDCILWTITIIDSAQAMEEWTVIRDGCHTVHFVIAKQ